MAGANFSHLQDRFLYGLKNYDQDFYKALLPTTVNEQIHLIFILPKIHSHRKNDYFFFNISIKYSIAFWVNSNCTSSGFF